MNSDQKNQLTAVIDLLNAIDIDKKTVEIYGATADLHQVIHGEISIKELVVEYNKVLKDFVALFDSKNWKWIPFDWSHPNLGGNNLINHFNQILGCLQQNRPFNEFAQSLEWLNLFSITFRLREQAKSSVASKKQEELDSKEKELSILGMQLVKYKEEIASLISQLTEDKKVLAEFYQQKLNELKQVTESLQTVTTQKGEIDTILQNVSRIDSEIRTVQKNHNELYEQLKGQKEGQEKDFKILATELTAEQVQLKKAIEDAEEKVTYFNGLEEYIKEKRKEIIELGALAAGAALGGTFGLREKDLGKDLRFWQYAVPVITVISMIWVIIVFTCLKADTNNIWANIILNIAKTIPAFVLMGFVFRQYTKERNLREEYAFKAAVANTINAYSDLLKNEDKPDNASRQEMLKKVIYQVQNPPKLYSEPSGSIFSFRTKHISEAIKNLNETVKGINPKG